MSPVGPLTKGVVAAEFLVQTRSAIAASIVGQLSLPQKLDKEVTTIEGVGAPMNLVEFGGTAVYQDLSKYTVDITSKRYQGGFKYDEATPNDRVWGIVQPKIATLGINAANHALSLFSAFAEAGTAGLCYDGLAFYNALHVIGKGQTQSNLLSGNGIATLDAIVTDFWLAYAALKGMKTDTGDPIYRNNLKLLVRCPLAIESMFITLSKAPLIAGGTNTLMGMFDIWADPGLTDVEDWYLDVVSEPEKPFIYGTFDAPKTKLIADEDAYKIKVSVSVHHGFAYGDYKQSVKINN